MNLLKLYNEAVEDLYEIVLVDTYEKAKEITQNTRWNLASDKDSFDLMKKDHGNIFVIVNKKEPLEKYLITDPNECIDTDNGRISRKDFKEIFSPELVDELDDMIWHEDIGDNTPDFQD